MSISQSDIDALMGATTTEPEGPMPVDVAAPQAAASIVPAPVTDSEPVAPSPDELRRILDIEVSVSVTLAEKRMPVENILGVTVGTIVEFDRAFDSELIIRVGDRPVGAGQAVKIGENFGLRITRIGDAHDRVDAMGGR